MVASEPYVQAAYINLDIADHVLTSLYLARFW
jgi:hypothetical protein